MDRSAASHRSHDESLVVRLFGGDVNTRDRELALALVADCDSCAGLFGDLGAIATATIGLPVPPRAREFTLGVDDVELLRPTRRRELGRIFGLDRVRSLGGSLVAMGLAGIIFVAGASAVAPQASTIASRSGPAAAYVANAPATESSTAVPVRPGTTATTVNPPSLPGFAPGGVGFSAAGSSAQALTLPAGVSVGSGDNGNGTGKGSQPTSPASGVAGNVSVVGSATDLSGPIGFDWRLVVGLGSVAILLLGLLVLVMPRRMPRRSGR